MGMVAVAIGVAHPRLVLQVASGDVIGIGDQFTRQSITAARVSRSFFGIRRVVASLRHESHRLRYLPI